MTYNIRHGAPAGGHAALDRILAAVASFGADVVALQEVDRRVVRSGFADQAARIADASGLSANFAAARRLGVIGQYGNALLVRGPVECLETLRLRSTGEQRVAIFASVRLDGHAVTAVSTHLQNSPRGRPSEAPGQLDQVLDELARWPRPWVLMGDLNLRPDVVLPRLEAAGLQAVEAPPTFPSDAPRIRIDWIAVAGLTVRSVEVPDLRASDHRPILTELDVDAPDAERLAQAPTTQSGVEESRG